MASGFWDWHYIGQSLPFLAGGIVTTLSVCALAGVLMVPIALLAAAGRMSNAWPIRSAATLYVNFFRSTPFLIQLVWLYFALPMALPFEIGPVQAAVMGLALYTGAYEAEVIRSGILSLEEGQSAAGLALGMTRSQVLRRIVLPQAALRTVPPSINVLIILIKESAVVSAVSVTDLMWRSAAVGTRSYRPVEPLLFACGVYIAIVMPLALVSRRLYGGQRLFIE